MGDGETREVTVSADQRARTVTVWIAPGQVVRTVTLDSDTSVDYRDDGTIAAVRIRFARFVGEVVPGGKISRTDHLSLQQLADRVDAQLAGRRPGRAEV